MPTHPVRCPACQAPLELPDALLGTTVRCGGCQHMFTAPAPPPPAPAPAPRRATPIPAAPEQPRVRSRRDDDEDDRPRRKPKKAASGGGGMMVLGLLAAGVVVLLLVGGGVAAYFVFGSEEKTQAAGGQQPQPNPPPPVEAAPFAAPGGKELTAEVLRKVKAGTVRVDVVLGRGEEGNGTGFLVHPQGLLVTNAHVVGYSRQEGNRPARSVKVVFNCGEGRTERTVRASVFGVDGDGDLAVLRVDPAGLPEALTLGSATGLRETQDLYVFGFPLGDIAGKEITVSTTTVSSLRKENGALTAVQVNGGMHPGNSGGPLTDKGGQVVGVAVAGILGTDLHFAIPADLVDRFVRDQIAAGGVTKPATVVGRPRRDRDDPPFLPPTVVRPPGFPRFGPR